MFIGMPNGGCFTNRVSSAVTRHATEKKVDLFGGNPIGRDVASKSRDKPMLMIEWLMHSNFHSTVIRHVGDRAAHPYR